MNNLKYVTLHIASPEDIIAWAKDKEVTNNRTINYKKNKPLEGGLFCEKIFGPIADNKCACESKNSKKKVAGMICEHCGVEIGYKVVRRERMGYIRLATPIAHVWFYKGLTSRIGKVLNIKGSELMNVIRFQARIVLSPGEATTGDEEKKILSKKQVLTDQNGRAAYVNILKYILKINTNNGELNHYAQIAKSYLEIIETDPSFDWVTYTRFIEQQTKAVISSGSEPILELLQELDLKKEIKELNDEIKAASKSKKKELLARLDLLEAFVQSKNKPEWMILTHLPVIPPELRPMLPIDGVQTAAGDLNTLYARVIDSNNNLRDMIKNQATSTIITNEKRKLQNEIDCLFENEKNTQSVKKNRQGRPYKSLSANLQGKQGRFRLNLLGKRVDYSGRSVIAIGPELKMNQCGIPRDMALQLFKPFIIHVLKEKNLSTSNRDADKLISTADSRALDCLEEIIGDHIVLLNRAPTLHRLGIQAFEPVLVDGQAIRLHPLVTTGFNADFDGDQMAVHVPLSHEARAEAKLLMIASQNILSPKDGKPIVTPSQDMVLGNYYLTLEMSSKGYKELIDQNKKTDKNKVELYTNCLENEGKIYSSITELQYAYNNKQIDLHTRIALPINQIDKDEEQAPETIAFFTKKKDAQTEKANGYLITTYGKVIFNSIFKKSFPFLNEPTLENLKKTPEKYFCKYGTNPKKYIETLSSPEPFNKSFLSKIIDAVYNRYGTAETSRMLDDLKTQGFEYSTISGITIAIGDINSIESRKSIISSAEEKVKSIQHYAKEGLMSEDERYKEVIDIWTKAKDEITVQVEKSFKENNRNPLCIMMNSGARGSAANFSQIIGMRGLMSSPSGKTIEIPITSNLRKGLNVSEFFTSTHGGRKGGADTALKTSKSGYLTRRLADVSHSIVITEVDCGTDQGFVVKEIGSTNSDKSSKPYVQFKDRIIGRYTIRDVVHPATNDIIVEGNTLIDVNIADQIVEAGITELEIRSIFGCKSRNGVCAHCYGLNLASGKVVEIGEAVGTIAAQSIGEPGTQLTMRTFHTGGVAGEDITQGLPRVEELFEARKSFGENQTAIISEIDGVVASIDDLTENDNRVILIKHDYYDFDDDGMKKSENKEYLVKSKRINILVKPGQSVKAGDKLTEGSIDTYKLLEVANVTAVQNYIIEEVQKVYGQQGIGISDKHIEIIVKQMLQKVIVIDGGDTKLLPGTHVNIYDFTDANTEVFKSAVHKKRPAVAYPLLQGIKSASLNVDSFLSAVSFQETTKTLVNAAIRGKRDDLLGLKENVITGKLIPAGTGLEKYKNTGYVVNYNGKYAKMSHIEDTDNTDEL